LRSGGETHGNEKLTTDGTSCAPALRSRGELHGKNYREGKLAEDHLKKHVRSGGKEKRKKRWTTTRLHFKDPWKEKRAGETPPQSVPACENKAWTEPLNKGVRKNYQAQGLKPRIEQERESSAPGQKRTANAGVCKDVPEKKGT